MHLLNVAIFPGLQTLLLNRNFKDKQQIFEQYRTCTRLSFMTTRRGEKRPNLLWAPMPAINCPIAINATMLMATRTMRSGDLWVCESINERVNEWERESEIEIWRNAQLSNAHFFSYTFLWTREWRGFCGAILQCRASINCDKRSTK